MSDETLQFLAAVEVKHDAFREWINAMNTQPVVQVPHIVYPVGREELVVPMVGVVPAEWSIA
jgi:hypothetical protein